ncbi:hypothetical protein TNCV_4965771 [Trichonephila clavipes]|nr:hypothetical protein TNCV_4965771 [Trichonephila clavipes]
MDAADFLHHENPPTWAGAGHTTLGVQGPRQTDCATQPSQEGKVAKVKTVIIQKRDSSVDTTWTYSVVHVQRSSHHWCRKRLWYPVRSKQSNGRLADIPLCCKRRRMVLVDNEWCVTD